MISLEFGEMVAPSILDGGPICPDAEHRQIVFESMDRTIEIVVCRQLQC